MLPKSFLHIFIYQVFISNANDFNHLVDPYMGLKQILPIRVRVNLELMIMKKYSSQPQFSELWPISQMQFTFINRAPVFE